MPKISEEEDAESAALKPAAAAPTRRTRTVSERPNGHLPYNTSAVHLKTLRLELMHYLKKNEHFTSLYSIMFSSFILVLNV
jgi:hypothetical protein